MGGILFFGIIGVGLYFMGGHARTVAEVLGMIGGVGVVGLGIGKMFGSGTAAGFFILVSVAFLIYAMFSGVSFSPDELWRATPKGR